MLGQGWLSQWERVGRRLEDVRAVYKGAPGGTDAAIDAVLPFFETVHHLKDWLTNDPASGVTTAEVHTLIDGSPALQLCADLANGSKHFKLDPQHRTQTGTTPRQSRGTTSSYSSARAPQRTASTLRPVARSTTSWRSPKKL
ncbi:hypothetical protein J7I98_26765 [Streptomyces sp. ISL-98]|uniref:hypothetical protein n=1 Tax=Streptomyces sp. ISL-98 TaxID=2819192 RepID=UPI001BE7D3F8|nr:hypothetical protein [Streptomyces sp. ISL-98]MBT2509418.1 hypothetical protein [Streptomyces sp. ISL-98]